MTVKEAIEILMKVKDKSKKLVTENYDYDSDGDCWDYYQTISDIEEDDTKVIFDLRQVDIYE